MTVRLRQVALVARELPAAERSIEHDLGLSRCFRDPGVAEFGLGNALYPIGDSLLEVVSPLPGAAGTTAGRFLDRRRGDGGYMAIFETDEPVDEVRARVAGLGVRVVFEARAPGVTGLHLHPADVGGAIVSIDRTDTWGEWPWAGPSWRSHRTTAIGRLAGVRIGVDDPGRTAQRWAGALGSGSVSTTSASHTRTAGSVAESGTARSVAGSGTARSVADPMTTTSATLDLDDGTFVEFVPAGDRGPGIDAVVVETSGTPSAVVIAGCTFELVAPLDPDAVFRAIEVGDLDAVGRRWADDIAVWHNTDGVTQDRAANLATLGWLVERTVRREYRDVRRRATRDGFVQQHVLHLEFADGRSADLAAAMVVAVRAGTVRRIDEYLDGAAVTAAFT
jgi:ketosteroid isomerase-like protein